MNSTPDLISPQKSNSSNSYELESSGSKTMNTPEGKNENFHDNLSESQVQPAVPSPNTGKGAYVMVSICCVMVAFGGFIFGWDTGTISGFVAQIDFLRRFGMKPVSYTHLDVYKRQG